MEDAHETDNFMDLLLQEAESKENSLLDATYDLVLLEIEKLETQITRNFEISTEEVKIVTDWALLRNLKLQERLNWLEVKLEAFIRERGVKTIDLPHGVLKIRKTQGKVEITDLDSFLATAKNELLTTIPETVKPDIAAIKEYIKTWKEIPSGVTTIPGGDRFSYKLKSTNGTGDSDDGNNEE